MKIWHFDAQPNPEAINGASNSAWQIAAAQAQAGQDVTLFLSGASEESGERVAKEAGLKVMEAAGFSGLPRRYNALAAEHGWPDMVQMHSVFIPRHAQLARWCRRNSIPYVIKPAGGLSGGVLARGRWKKMPYSMLLERPRFMGAGGVVALTPVETKEIQAFVPGYRGVIQIITNPVVLPQANGSRSEPGNRFVFMGRFDVYHKGLDLLAEIARRTPEYEFDLYGQMAKGFDKELSALMSGAPENMHFHGPVRGAQKQQVLADARGLILTSRWEAFGRVVADAMAARVPCFVGERMALASLVRDERLGVVLPENPFLAAAELRRCASDDALLAEYAARAEEYARREFAPSNVAAKYLRLYERVITGHSVSEGGVPCTALT